MYAGHLDLAQPLWWTVDDALPPEPCAAYVERMRGGQAEVAPIVGKGGRPVIEPETRNNTRVMWDDADEADRLLTRVRERVLLFQHRVMHRACEVQAGEKFVLRTDVLYRPS